MTDLFAARPWLSGQVELPRRLGMLGESESRAFYYLAKDAFTGEGTIVDGGSFLGRSAVCFATGLRANPRHRPQHDRIHCFDLFRVPDEGSVEFLRRYAGVTRAVGDSTRDIFDGQVADVRELLEVHEGDFHTVVWQHQPIEILLVDIAKTRSLGQRVVASFFPDLIPGRSLVVQQDYHTPWLPHLHVVMEFFAPWFELVLPRVDDTAIFKLIAPIPPEALARAAAYEFQPAEEADLMDRAIARLPEADRSGVELARVILESQTGDVLSLLPVLESIERDAAATPVSSCFPRYLQGVRDTLEARAGWQCARGGDHGRMLQLADGLLARGSRDSTNLVMRGTALTALGRLDEGEAALREAVACSPCSRRAYAELARNLLRQRRLPEAESELVRGLEDRTARGPSAHMLFAALQQVWAQRKDLDHASRSLAALARNHDSEPELHVTAAHVDLHRGNRTAAARALGRARGRGLSAQRIQQLEQQTGIPSGDWPTA